MAKVEVSARGSGRRRLVSSGAAWGQGQPGPRPRPAETKPADAKPGETKPTEAAKPSELAMKPGEMLRPPSDPVVGIVEGHLIYLSDVGRAVPQLPRTCAACRSTRCSRWSLTGSSITTR